MGMPLATYHPMTSPCLTILLCLLVACGHETTRENPLDPQLTPAVRLTAELDTQAGAVALSWSQYEGKTAFEVYSVLRNVARSTQVDTLIRLTGLDSTSFVDGTLKPGTAYEYRVSVTNMGGLEVVSEKISVEGFSLVAANQLVAAPDPAAGRVQITWRAYAGPGFESYKLTRRIIGTDREVEVAVVSTATDTTWTDADALAGIDYLYTLTVQAAGETLDGGRAETRYELTPVALDEIRPDSRSATALLQWELYAGPRFSAYHVLRTSGTVVDTVAQIDDQAVVSVVDSGLVGSRVYSYRIDVVTDSLEVAEGPPGTSDPMHGLVGSWPLDLRGGSKVRLAFVDGRLEVLVADTSSVILQTYDRDGQQVEVIVLFAQPNLLQFQHPNLDPALASYATDADGRRHTLVGTEEIAILLVRDATGEVVTVSSELARVPQREGTQVAGVVTLSAQIEVARAEMTFDNVTVHAGGEQVASYPFDGVGLDDWEMSGLTEFAGVPTAQMHGDALLLTHPNQLDLQGEFAPTLKRREASWVNGLRLAADISSSADAQPQMYIGDDFQPVRMTISTDEVRIVSSFSAQIAPVPISLVQWVPNRFALWAEDGFVGASVESPVFWQQTRPAQRSWGHVNTIERIIVASVDASRFSFLEEEARGQSEQNAAASDVRVWDVDNTTFDSTTLMAICLTEEHRVVLGRAGASSFSGLVFWPDEGRASTYVLGTSAGQDNGELIFPLSVDRSTDGRHFVVDAGNGRIQVFDADGDYLTQWGSKGSGPDQFDFGSGNVSTDFAGSIAVDDEGFIYVADVGNQRIQKFAP